MAFPRWSGLADSIPVGKSAAVFCLVEVLVADGALQRVGFQLEMASLAELVGGGQGASLLKPGVRRRYGVAVSVAVPFDFDSRGSWDEAAGIL